MRLPLPAERLPVPLRSVFVEGERENDVNFAEAKAIVEKLAELVKDPTYKGRTFGVITLMANPAQAEVIQKLMFVAVPENEIRSRKIQVGDPKYFQGDERDVILLSMVVGGPNDSFVAQTKDSDKRRFNVAASRARDQMWLFHSVRPSEIRNEECLRLKLLSFFGKVNVEVPKSPT
jgi:superfamily I DNA and/or RNA helicase